ncbi:hypothetical protein AB1Y20_007432 [Prymnesium parvum]|uniref:Uncharacterized protein n=1 Tax=Prymnesium parvum TaxID=97485 RepID=A0AB34IW26_PRYPA
MLSTLHERREYNRQQHVLRYVRPHRQAPRLPHGASERPPPACASASGASAAFPPSAFSPPTSSASSPALLDAYLPTDFAAHATPPPSAVDAFLAPLLANAHKPPPHSHPPPPRRPPSPSHSPPAPPPAPRVPTASRPAPSRPPPAAPRPPPPSRSPADAVAPHGEPSARRAAPPHPTADALSADAETRRRARLQSWQAARGGTSAKEESISAKGEGSDAAGGESGAAGGEHDAPKAAAPPKIDPFGGAAACAARWRVPAIHREAHASALPRQAAAREGGELAGGEGSLRPRPASSSELPVAHEKVVQMQAAWREAERGMKDKIYELEAALAMARRPAAPKPARAAKARKAASADTTGRHSTGRAEEASSASKWSMTGRLRNHTEYDASEEDFVQQLEAVVNAVVRTLSPDFRVLEEELEKARHAGSILQANEAYDFVVKREETLKADVRRLQYDLQRHIGAEMQERDRSRQVEAELKEALSIMTAERNAHAKSKAQSPPERMSRRQVNAYLAPPLLQ